MVFNLVRTGFRHLLLLIAVLSIAGCGSDFDSGERVFVNIPGPSLITDGYATGTIVEKKGNTYLVQLAEVQAREDNPLSMGMMPGRSVYVSEDAISRYDQGKEEYESRRAIVKKVLSFISDPSRMQFPDEDLLQLKRIAAQQNNEDLRKTTDALDSVNQVVKSSDHDKTDAARVDAAFALSNMAIDRLMEGDSDAIKKAHSGRTGRLRLADRMRNLSLHQLVEIRFANQGYELFTTRVRSLGIDDLLQRMPEIRSLVEKHAALFLPDVAAAQVEKNVQAVVAPALQSAKEPVLSPRRQDPPKDRGEAERLLNEDRAKLADLSESLGFEVLDEDDAARYYFGPVEQLEKADDLAYTQALRSSSADGLRKLIAYTEKYPNGRNIAQAKEKIEVLRKALSEQAEAQAEYWTKVVSHKGAFEGKTKSGSIFTFHVIFDEIDEGGRSFSGRLAYNSGQWGVNKVKGKIEKDDDAGEGRLVFEEVGVLKRGKRKSLCTDCRFTFITPTNGSSWASGTRREGGTHDWNARLRVDKAYEFKVY